MPLKISGQNIIDAYNDKLCVVNKLDAFILLERVIDIVRVGKGTLLKSGKGQTSRQILKSWEDWFYKKGKPFVVVEYPDCYKLWKEDEVLEE